MRGSAYKPEARPGTRRQCPERSEPQGRARYECAGLTVRFRAWHLAMLSNGHFCFWGRIEINPLTALPSRQKFQNGGFAG